MEKPRRIQLSRRKGWRKPPNTVNVARPTKWGNPFRSSSYTQAQAVELYRTAVMGAMPIAFAAGLVRHVEIMELANAQVDRLAALPLHELRGKNLACWCPLDQPCHADVLLELANQ
jgi:hypothetical protein